MADRGARRVVVPPGLDLPGLEQPAPGRAGTLDGVELITDGGLSAPELDRMDGTESHFDAKFQVLAENVRHHIKEEENEMLPKAEKVKVDFEALAEKIKEAISLISDVSGFMGYYVVYAPDDTVIAISLFNNFAAAEESNKRALAWIEHDLAPLLTGPATALAGPVIVHTLA